MNQEFYKSKKFFYSYISFGSISFFWNLFFASVVNGILHYLINSKEDFELIYKIQFNDLKGFSLFLNILSYIVPSLFILNYYFPIYKFILSKKTTNEEKITYKILNAPFYSSIFGSIGWLIGTVSFIITFIHVFGIENSSLLIRGSFINILITFLTISSVYFTMDIINRKLIIPKLFTEDEIAKLPRANSKNLYYQFLIYFLTVSITPILLYLMILSPLIDEKIYLLLFITFIFILIGILLTRYITATISFPILKIQDVLFKIREGDFDAKAKVISNDEIGYLASSLNLMSKELKEKEFIKDSFGKMVDPRIRDLLLKDQINLIGEEKEVTVLFIDIRGFTSISENLEPQKLVSWLNLYFEKMGFCILKKEGIINKFIGDSIMGIFGAPIELKNSAKAAVESAILMREICREMNEELKKENLPELKIGIGIHTGKVILGNVGMKNRFEYTAIGDSVNTASRIESLCKEYNTDILFSEETRLLSGIENAKFISEANIRGKEKKVKIFSI